ncbi:spindle apparatus coiled-coil protein 1 spindly [Colletes latitarsis]|uniref:spindle apparatus coiled-coil protein 1 spindly n=1 Tax=Colletes latitarsis TaxID=2605962 RepID=UPI0040359DB5
MSTPQFVKQEINEEYTEDTEGISERYRLLKVEYEECRQEIHDLKRKLELNETMLRDVQEINETLESSLDRQISEKEKFIFEVEEKHRDAIKEYENIISSLESNLTNQTTEIEKLHQNINRFKEIECETIVDDLKNISLETENASLKNHVEKLTVLLHEEEKKSKHLEEMINDLKAQYDELQRIFQDVKEQLTEKSKALEHAREELVLKRAAAESTEIYPTHNSCKGNSLFAEVEDRRQNVMSKMKTLHEKYIQIKRMCMSQVAEIKVLRTKQVSAFRKWETDTDHILTEKDELIEKYKNRVLDLESKLKFEIKKNDDAKHLNCNDASFTYLQSLLDSKKKESNDLRIKIEDLSMQLLIQEEAKLNIAKQLQYWRYKVSSLEGRVCFLQSELKLGSSDNAECKILLKEFEDLMHLQNNDRADEPESKQPENYNQLPVLTSETVNKLLKNEADQTKHK